MRRLARAILLLLLQASSNALEQSCDASSSSRPRPLTLAELNERQAELNKIREAGYSCKEALAAGYNLSEIRKAGYSYKDAAISEDYGLKDAKSAGYSLKDATDALVDSRYTVKQLMELGYSAKDAADASEGTGVYNRYVDRVCQDAEDEACWRWSPQYR